MHKVLHITNRLGLGGAEVMLLDIIKNSNRSEFDYHILCPLGHGELDSQADSFNIPVHYLPHDSSSGRLTLLKDGINFIRKFRPHIVVTHSRFSDLIGLYGGCKTRIPIRIMTIHAAGMYFYDSKPIHEGIIEYFIAKYATHYIAVSNKAVEYLHKFGHIPLHKITMIPNGIAPERVCSPLVKDKETVRKSLGLDFNHFVILSVGRLIYEKGFDILLDEFKIFSEKIPHARLVIAGYGIEEKRLRKRASALNVDDKFLLIGKYPNLPELLQIADCYVMPSRQEGFGLSILEAMANALPVISTSVGVVPDLIRQRFNGFTFSIKNKGELASLLLEVYQNTDLAFQCGQNARRTALEKYHISNTVKKYEELYRQLLVVQTSCLH